MGVALEIAKLSFIAAVIQDEFVSGFHVRRLHERLVEVWAELENRPVAYMVAGIGPGRLLVDALCACGTVGR